MQGKSQKYKKHGKVISVSNTAQALALSVCMSLRMQKTKQQQQQPKIGKFIFPVKIELVFSAYSLVSNMREKYIYGKPSRSLSLYAQKNIWLVPYKHTVKCKLCKLSFP